MLVIAYIPCGSKAEAEKIGEALVKERLAACVNIHESFSICEWEGRTEKSKEFVIIAKTLDRRFGKLKKRVEEMHSYETPCILKIPAAEANDSYLNWVKKQVG